MDTVENFCRDVLRIVGTERQAVLQPTNRFWLEELFLVRLESMLGFFVSLLEAPLFGFFLCLEIALLHLLTLFQVVTGDSVGIGFASGTFALKVLLKRRLL